MTHILPCRGLGPLNIAVQIPGTTSITLNGQVRMRFAGMDNPYLTKAISSTKKLQLLITKMVEFEKDLLDQVSDSDYPAEMISKAFNEQDEPYTDETQLLAIVNDLLYRLMDYQRDADKWHDEEDVQQ